MEIKSSRNKTIDFTAKEGAKYLERCLFLKEPQDNSQLDFSRIKDKTICANSFFAMKNLPAKSFPLIIVDPPYNLSKTYSSSKFEAKKSSQYEYYTKDWLSLVLPLLTDTGSIYICVDWQSSIIVGKVLSEMEDRHELFIRNRITWEREKGSGAKSNWKNCHEDIWFVTRSQEYTFNIDDVKVRRKVLAPYKENGVAKDWKKGNGENFRDTCPSNFWNDITIPFWSMSENTAHPTQKPEKLLAKLILASSNKGDIVFDPFAGSGSTAVSAKKLGRHWCTIEKEEQFCAWTEYRLERAETDKTIQGFEDGIFHMRNF